MPDINTTYVQQDFGQSMNLSSPWTNFHPSENAHTLFTSPLLITPNRYANKVSQVLKANADHSTAIVVGRGLEMV
jgi:hypothetical protein